MQWITNERRLAIYLRDGFLCVLCQCDLHDAAPEEITLDHIIPRSKGGSNRSFNLVTVCRSDNSSKKDKCHKKYANERYPGALKRINSQRRKRINLELAKAIIAGRTPKQEARA